MARQDNSLWLGLFLKGALHYIPHLNRTIDYNLLSDEVLLPASASSKTRTIISGTEALSGLFLIDKKKANSRPEKISSLRVFNLVQFNDSILWAGNPKRQYISDQYPYTESNPRSLSCRIPISTSPISTPIHINGYG